MPTMAEIAAATQPVNVKLTNKSSDVIKLPPRKKDGPAIELKPDESIEVPAPYFHRFGLDPALVAALASNKLVVGDKPHSIVEATSPDAPKAAALESTATVEAPAPVTADAEAYASSPEGDEATKP